MSNKPRRETRRSQILRVFTENGSTFDGMSQSVIMEEIMLNFITQHKLGILQRLII